MRQTDFERRGEARWRRFEALLRRADQARGDGLLRRGLPREAADLPREYRAICRDLSLAIDRRYSPRLLDRLNELALGGHRVLYARRAELGRRALAFFAYGFPRRVRALVGFVVLATALFVVPAVALFATVTERPDLVYSVFSFDQVAGFEAMYDPAAEHLGTDRESSGDWAMFGLYVWNNVGVAFRCFALGLFLGVGSAIALVFNGLILGALAAHMLHLGFAHTFFPFVIGHGAFELTAIVLSGAAGLRLGHAIWAPGARTRLEALRIAVAEAMDVVYGVVPMLVVAAVLEAFWSSKASLPVGLKLGVGGALWAIVLAYLVGAGRWRADREEHAGGA